MITSSVRVICLFGIGLILIGSKTFPADVTDWRDEYKNQLREHSELSHLLMKMSALPSKASNCNTVNTFNVAY